MNNNNNNCWADKISTLVSTTDLMKPEVDVEI